MKTDRLVICNVSEASAVFDEKLWVETPSNDRTSDDVVIAIDICSLRDVEELTAFAGVASSELLAPSIDSEI